LRDQLKKLDELQKYDAQIRELTNALQAIPAKLESTRNDLARVEGLLASERAQLAETQKYYNDQKDLAQTDEGHLSGAKTKQSAAKNTKEYAAAQRELETSRESLAARQTEITKLVEAIQAKEKLLAERSADVKTLRDSVGKDDDQAKARMSEIEGKINALKTDREKIAAGVRPDVLKRYSAIRTRKGLALAAVSNGTCHGCNMNIPPQLFNVLQRGTSVETCPYCHRIIYWADLMIDPAEAAAAAAAAAAAKPEKPEKPDKKAEKRAEKLAEKAAEKAEKAGEKNA
jgi:predicted  nucleic acid-binding Zn-ribbon protein